MYTDIETFALAATQSDVFAAGIGLGLIGLAAGLLRVIYGHLSAFIARRIFVSVTLDNRTDAFRNLTLWLHETGVLAHVRRVQMTDVRANDQEVLGPVPGMHWFVFQRRLCWFYREIDEKAKVGAHGESRARETISVTVLFGRVSNIQAWIAEGAALYDRQERIGPGLYVLKGDWWDYMGDVPARALETVLTDDNRLKDIADDVAQFYNARHWYASRGVPWRRGYLLYGPPGTGKSSAIRAIASHLQRDIATMDIGRSGLTDDDLREAMFSAPADALIAIEDIDAIFTKRDSHRGGVSFSGLLNAIDGLAAQEGRALFMTTNHKERLDPALIRPGRADLHVELGHVSPETARRLFLRFFPGETAAAERFETALSGRRFAPATLQGWLLQNAQDAAQASAAQGLTDHLCVAAE